MTNQIQIDQPQTNFQQMLEDYDYERPSRGDFFDGLILQIDGEYAIHIDIGGKTDAVVTQEEIEHTPHTILSELNEGDVVPVYVIKGSSTTHKPQVSIRKGMEQEDWAHAKRDLEEENLLDVEIIGENKGGLLASYGRLQGFIPNSLAPALGRNNSSDQLREIKQNMIGQTVKVQVIEVEARRQRLILSARAAREELRQDRMDELEVGQVHTGRVVNVVDFGVFVSLDGIDGLVHISELSHEHVGHPSDVCAVGDQIDVQIISIDRDRERIGLSHKKTLAVPQEELQALKDSFTF